MPSGSLAKNFSMRKFTRRYRASGSPLAPRGCGASDVRSPDFTDWQLHLHPNWVQQIAASSEQFHGICLKDLQTLSQEALLCCPEDQWCDGDCVSKKLLCHRCRVLICRECCKFLSANAVIPEGLVNDNWQGYIDAWVYEMGVTWMEKTVSSPFWTGITLFSVGRRDGNRKRRRQHLLHDAMYSSENRLAFKGQVFTAPMNWSNIQKQLKEMDADEVAVFLPLLGQVLQARVQVSIASGLVDLNKCLKGATVRRPVVTQLIQIRRDAGHPD